VLNVVALAAFGYLYYLYKNASRFGGGDGYAKDVVCGMQVRQSDAPARSTHQGRTYYFCSDKCEHKFDADPAKYAGGQATSAMSEPASGQVTDPVCGMSVDPETAAARTQHAGHEVFFCSTGCRDRFVADPAAYEPSAAR